MSENLSQILNNIFEIENISNRKSKQLSELKHNCMNSEFDLKNVLRNQQQLKDKKPQLVREFPLIYLFFPQSVFINPPKFRFSSRTLKNLSGKELKKILIFTGFLLNYLKIKLEMHSTT